MIYMPIGKVVLILVGFMLVGFFAGYFFNPTPKA